MLIHIGNNEFVDFCQTEMIINLQTIDEESRNRILSSLPSYERAGARSAILTTDGKWLASTLSSEALSMRGVTHSFGQAEYLKSEWRNSNRYRY